MRDLRKYSSQTTTRLVIGSLLILFIVGDGLIALIYGPSQALVGLLCLILGLSPFVILFAVFWVMDWIVKRANRDQ